MTDGASRSFIIKGEPTEFVDRGSRWSVSLTTDGLVRVTRGAALCDPEGEPVVPLGAVAFCSFTPSEGLEVTWLADGRPAGVARFDTWSELWQVPTGEESQAAEVPPPDLDEVIPPNLAWLQLHHAPQATITRRRRGLEWLPTARQLMAHLIIPWALVLIATLAFTCLTSVVAVAIFGHRGGWAAIAVGVLVGSLVAWVSAALGWPVWLDTLRREELIPRRAPTTEREEE